MKQFCSELWEELQTITKVALAAILALLIMWALASMCHWLKPKADELTMGWLKAVSKVALSIVAMLDALFTFGVVLLFGIAGAVVAFRGCRSSIEKLSKVEGGSASDGYRIQWSDFRFLISHLLVSGLALAFLWAFISIPPCLAQRLPEEAKVFSAGAGAGMILNLILLVMLTAGTLILLLIAVLKVLGMRGALEWIHTNSRTSGIVKK